VSDRYQQITNSPIGAVTKRLGMPTPPRLRRYEPGQPVVSGSVVLGGASEGRLGEPVREVLTSLGVRLEQGGAEAVDGAGLAAILFDASGIAAIPELRSLYEFFHEQLGGLGSNGRVVVLASVPEQAGDPAEATAQSAIEGFTRSVAKEIGRNGSTAQLVRVAGGAEGAMESTLRFLLSARSAFVDGQVIEIEQPGEEVVPPEDWQRPLAGRVAGVTGAARGIGEAIAEKLSELGAEVIAIDVPGAGDSLSEVANRVGGSSLDLDITDSAAPERLRERIAERHGRVDAFVHNAGITRDKTLKRMPREDWDAVLAVNLTAQERINEALLEGDLLGRGGRLISVSSVSGIAGNRGQTNYATSKAGVIGMVRALAPILRERGATANAVAPGFIETAMTAAMPIGTREAGRRTNSLVQGGQPVDVAETIGWLASPASDGVNGNVVRVCGQGLIGA
jgi:3-oxoacyl-[acyl-carrier protein] reductase